MRLVGTITKSKRIVNRPRFMSMPLFTVTQVSSLGMCDDIRVSFEVSLTSLFQDRTVGP